MNRFDFRIYYHIIRIIKTIRRIYYGGEKLKKKPMRTAPKITKRFLWNGTTVKRVLTNEFYKGTGICRTCRTCRTFQRLSVGGS